MVDAISDPTSRRYRQFLTPEEVGAQFGQSTATVQAIASYLQSNGLTVKLISKNHISILADGTVAQAEKAFATTINDFTSYNTYEPGNPNFFSFSTPLHMPANIAPYVLAVTGLENYTKPQMRALTPTQTRVLYNTAPMYNINLHGDARNVAISSFDGFRLTNVPLYYSQYGLPTPPSGVGSNITVKKISGGAGTGTPQGEGDLDIQMVLGMAPFCTFTIYDGGASDLIGVLTQEVNDNSADIISESYGWNLPAASATSAHNLHLSMSAQGITYMAATGDSGTTIEPFSYPNYDPEVLMVGGTVATTDASGNRTSEVGWASGGGGWSTNTATFNTLPSWQHGTGVPTGNNHRLSPDVALNAGGSGAYFFYFNGSLSSGFVGTSFASPVFAGCLAVAEQTIIHNGGLPPNGSGKQRFGRIQDLIYAQNGRSDVWFDVTSGSNGKLPDGTTSSAHAGWDFVTGWGAMNFNAFVTSQGGGTVTIPPAPTGLAATAGNAQVGLTWVASSGATSYNVKRATVSGGPYTTVGTSTTTGFTNTGLTNGTTYFFVVTAVNSAGESGNSNQASATPFVSTLTQLLLNPGFESGNVNWTTTAGVIDSSTGEAAHTGTWKAWLDGYGQAHTDTCYQQVTIPSTATTATLTFWLHIDTAETTTTTAFDKLTVTIRNSANTVLSTLATYSNLNKGTGYTQKTFDVTSFKGQTIRVYFSGVEDASLQTSFVVDDTALNVQ
jgi:subtilase family serine protease